MNARLRLTCLAAAMACSLAATALAHSDEAIADAEALLKEATDDVTSRRPANAQDLCVVRYYLLQLKLAAGKLTPDAFCRQAQAELRAMTVVEGPVKAGLEERSDKIEAMTISPEACQQAIAAVDDFLFDIGEPAKSDEDVKEAERVLAETQKQYKNGETDRVALARAEADAFEARYMAGKLTREAYCASGQATSLANLTNWIEQLAQVGQGGVLGRVAAKRRYYEFKGLCPAK